MSVENSKPESGSTLRKLLLHPVARNALALYAVQFAGYLIPLVTLPYLARVLRPQGFGLLLFAQSFALWTSLAIEYGFNLSATREVARNRADRRVLARTAAGVLGAKAVLVAAMIGIAMVAGVSAPVFREHPAYLWWALPQSLAFGLSPFWYFQGTEKMVRAVGVDFVARACGTGAIFLIVRTPADGWKALAAQAAAGCASTLLQTLWMYREIGFLRPAWHTAVEALRRGWDMFLFRGAYQFYTSANTFILGLFVAPLQVGYFGGAERIERALQGLALPFTQAVYPRMSHLAGQNARSTARIARYTLSFACAIGVGLAVLLAVAAPQIARIILGPGYDASVPVLRVFALVLPINALNTALIMQWMLPHGMERQVGAITLGTFVANVAAAVLLAPRFAQLGMAWAIVIAESLMLLGLLAVMLRRYILRARAFGEASRPGPELL
jgi:PST family polysaccharide transporter